MKIIIKLYLPGTQTPRFIGELKAEGVNGAEDLTPKDLLLLWDAERAINESQAGRAHLDLESD